MEPGRFPSAAIYDGGSRRMLIAIAVDGKPSKHVQFPHNPDCLLPPDSHKSWYGLHEESDDLPRLRRRQKQFGRLTSHKEVGGRFIKGLVA